MALKANNEVSRSHSLYTHQQCMPLALFTNRIASISPDAAFYIEFLPEYQCLLLWSGFDAELTKVLLMLVAVKYHASTVGCCLHFVWNELQCSIYIH